MTFHSSFLWLLFLILLLKCFMTSNAQAENETSLGSYRSLETDETSVNEPKRRNALSDREIIENVLRNYRFPEPSANITVAVHISIDRILNDAEHECSFWLTIRQKWVETKLVYEKERPNGAFIRLRSSSYIWNPSIAVQNGLDVRTVGKEETEVHSNGMVELVQRLSVKTMEIHDLHMFPLDKRNCSLVFYNEDTRAQWTGITSITVPRVGWGAWTVLGCERVGKTIIVSLKRSITMWIWMLYAPTTVLFICSWISLWATGSSAKNRFVTSTTAFFTILVIIICSNWNVPRTSYPKAIDVWNLLIAAFAFFIVLQSVFTAKKDAKKRKTSKRINSFGDESNEKTQWFNDMPYYAHLPERQPSALARILDYIFRIILPIAFFAACTLYFIHYVYPYIR